MDHRTSSRWHRWRIERTAARPARGRRALMVIRRRRIAAVKRLAPVALAIALAACGEDALPEPPPMPRPAPTSTPGHAPERPPPTSPSPKANGGAPSRLTSPDQMNAKELLNGRVRFRVPVGWQLGLGPGTRDPAASSERTYFKVPYPLQRDPDSLTPPTEPESGVPVHVDDARAWLVAEVTRGRQTIASFAKRWRFPMPGDRILEDATGPDRRVVVARRVALEEDTSLFDCFRVTGGLGVYFHLSYDLKQKPPAAWKAATDADARAVCASITIDEKQ